MILQPFIHQFLSMDAIGRPSLVGIGVCPDLIERDVAEHFVLDVPLIIDVFYRSVRERPAQNGVLLLFICLGLGIFNPLVNHPQAEIGTAVLYLACDVGISQGFDTVILLAPFSGYLLSMGFNLRSDIFNCCLGAGLSAGSSGLRIVFKLV